MATDQSDQRDSTRRADPFQRYVIALAEAGYDDPLQTFDDLDERVLTRRRLEIIETLADDDFDVESIRDLARQLDRHVSIVKEDLDILARNDLIAYETDGTRKIPVLKHRNVFVRPVLLEGEFQWGPVLADAQADGDDDAATDATADPGEDAEK